MAIPARFLLVLWSALATACGGGQAPVDIASPAAARAPEQGCARVFESDAISESLLGPAKQAAQHGHFERALQHGERAFETWTDDAVQTFGGQGDAAERRAFFERWVNVDPPVLSVGDDRFIVTRPVALLFACSAQAVGEHETMRRWLYRGGLPMDISAAQLAADPMGAEPSVP